MPKLLKVYGFVRSGNNFLMELLARNFYPGLNLSSAPGSIGHWSSRVHGQTNPRGKLAGSHNLPKNTSYNKGNAIYIYRDGRDVISSLWNSDNFHGNEHKSFSGYLRSNIDWFETVGRKANPEITVVEHWMNHLDAWKNTGAYMVRYEDLCENSSVEMKRIAENFGLIRRSEYLDAKTPVGWYPNRAVPGTWNDLFSDDDLKFFFSIVPEDYWGLYHG